MNIISELTKNCKSTDCRIINNGSITTVLSWKYEYNKNGELITKDPNTITTNYSCKKCGKKWVHNVNAANYVDQIIEMRL